MPRRLIEDEHFWIGFGTAIVFIAGLEIFSAALIVAVLKLV